MAETQQSRQTLNLTTLPSELRRLIVSHLAPHPDDLKRGCKKDLRAANLTHSCLREWATEYMYRDMALQHVMAGISSQLELFGITEGNEKLTKYVKHIRVQVPPALRWDIGSDDPHGNHLERMTHSRLRKKFGVTKASQLSDEQRQYAKDYHRAMVEPFTDNRWYRLLRAADHLWDRVFKLFENLEEISVGTCSIADHPAPTYTYTFLLRHGKTVVDEPDPPFVLDSNVNLSWASSIVMRSAPPTVRLLRLTLANMDNFNSYGTVNRLLELSYRQVPDNRKIRARKVSLALNGIRGTHGSRDWHGDTGSAGVVRQWKNMLNSTQGLQHFELRNNLRINEVRFSDLEMTDVNACIIDWILPDLNLPQLRTLKLVDFQFDTRVLLKTLSGHWPNLEHIILENPSLRKADYVGDGFVIKLEELAHVQGRSWVEICNAIIDKHPGIRITLSRPVSKKSEDINFQVHPKYIGQLENIPGVEVDVQGLYAQDTQGPIDKGWSVPVQRSLPVLPDVPSTPVT